MSRAIETRYRKVDEICKYKFRSLPKKIKFFIKDFFVKCDQIRRKLQIWSHLLKKSLMENFIFCAVDKMQGFVIINNVGTKIM